MSEFFDLNLKDLGKGLLIAVAGSILSGLYHILEVGGIPTWPQIKVILLTGLGAGIGYLLKNWLTNSDNKLLTGEGKSE